MQEYEGILTEGEYAEIGRLRQELSSALVVLVAATPYPGPWVVATRVGEEQRGRVSEDALEVRVGECEARIPWEAFIAYAASADAVLLSVGRLAVPVARSFFKSRGEWEAARAMIGERVPRAGPVRTQPSWLRPVKVALLWLALAVVVYLGWHFADYSSPR